MGPRESNFTTTAKIKNTGLKTSNPQPLAITSKTRFKEILF